jgi:GntR family transcriptional regulator
MLTDPRPLHQRVAAVIRDEIMSGLLAPGAHLPSTPRLKDRFEASSATVQKAIQLLKDEGLLVGRPGANVSVREHRQRTIRPADTIAPVDPGAPYRWIALANQQGRTASSKLLDVAVVETPAEVALALNLSRGNQNALMRHQLLMLDGEPAELVTSYYPLEIAQDTPMMERRKIRGGTPTLLAELGYLPRKCVDLVSARVPTPEQYEALELPGELPVLRTFRVVYSDGDRPIEVTIMVKAGHLYELQYEF